MPVEHSGAAIMTRESLAAYTVLGELGQPAYG
jgi:hypothetical protein